METLIGCHTEADAKKYQLWAAMVNADGICHVIESNKKRKAVISWPFTFRRGSTLSDSSVPPELKAPLFDQPLSIVCEDDSLPKPIHDILKILRIQGPVTEGVFRKAANEKARKELKEELNYGKMLDLKSKPVHLLAVVLKDYLRGIPHQLLSSDLYQEWLAALEKPSLEEKIEEMKCVAAKLPRPNWVLLQHLICVLHNISKTSAVNKMDANNLAVCIGPNMLIPPQDKSLSLETQKQLNDKVITLVEFFIDNCFDLFGDNVSDLLGTSEHDSLEDLDPAELTSHQNDSAYDSTDPEHEGQASTISDYQINQWTINTSSSEELQCSLDQDLDMSGSSVTRFINAISSMERRCSEPYIYPSQNSKEVSGQKLTRSHDDVTVHNNTACLTDVDLSKKVSERALYRKKMPKGLKVNTNYNAGVSDDLHNACSNCSLESSFSDCSVFTSSPLISPSSPKRAGLLRHQSCSMKCKARSDTTPTGKEIKKHSKSFSYGNHKKMLTKTQSWGPEGEKAGLQRNEFSSGLRNKSGHEYDGTQNKPFQQPAVVRLRQPQSARKLSVDEVFRMVDQRNPGKPPSYEEAIHKNVLSHISMTVQTMRASISSKDCSTPNSTNEHIMDSSYRDDKRHSGNHQNSVNGTQTPEPCVEAAETIYQGGKPKATIVRTMSGFIQKNKHEYINRRCSQPLEIYDQIQYAKESYV
ncbi:T-cell activation Rho GTPase-activating protein [Rhinophrynus dorsalis]